MAIGRSLYSLKIFGQVLGLTSLTLCLSSCGIARKSKTCNLKADGLKVAGFSGHHLESKQLSLVFLEGPGHHTEEIGEALHGAHIPATFFIKGEDVHGHEEVLDKLVDQGHRIASGGFTFEDLKSVKDPVLDLRAADKIITPYAFGHQYWLFGEPGSLDAGTITQLKNAGLGKYIGPIHPDTEGETFLEDEKCWESGLAVGQCVQGYFDEIVHIDRGIIPFHSEDERSLKLLQQLIPELVAFGFTFVPLDKIPDLRLALTAAGGIPDAGKGAEVCNDYE